MPAGSHAERRGRLGRRTRILMRIAVLAGTLLLVPIAQAQFHSPSDAELKITADPSVPGAAAICLDREEIQGGTFLKVTMRIKVLTEKGKELATVELPEEDSDRRIIAVKARTVLPDGTVIPMTAKPDDLLIVKSDDEKITHKVITLPGVVVGSILEYHYEMASDKYLIPTPQWQLQLPYTVLHEHFIFSPVVNINIGGYSSTVLDEDDNALRTLLWWSKLPPGAEVKRLPHYFDLDLSNVPPLPQEEFAPPTSSRAYSLSFYYTRYVDPKDYWPHLSQQMSRRYERFAGAHDVIQEAAATLVASSDSDLNKARKLYTAVQSLENTDFTRVKGKTERKEENLGNISNASGVWQQKSGTGNEIALLYLTLLRAAGLHAYAILIVDREEHLFNPALLTERQLGSVLVVLELDGKLRVLDPGQKMCPFGFLPWNHSIAGGIREGGEGNVQVATPMMPVRLNAVTRAADLAVDADGTVHGVARWTLTGQEALDWRQRAIAVGEEELKKQFDAFLVEQLPDGVSAHVEHFEALGNPDVPLAVTVSVGGRMGVSTVGHHLLVPAHFFASRTMQPFVHEASRTEAVDMHYAAMSSDAVTYHLPEGFSVDGLPPDLPIVWTGQAVFQATFRLSANTVSISRVFGRSTAIFDAKQYNDLRDFYQKVAAADEQQIVFKQAGSAASN
jgi:hypothetical protein